MKVATQAFIGFKVASAPWTGTELDSDDADPVAEKPIKLY